MKAAILAALACASCASRAFAQSDHAVLFVGGHVLDADGERWLSDASVLVIGERIAEIGRDAEAKAPKDVQRIDLHGAYLLPGLIDLHTHLLLHPYDETKWDDQVLRESLELRTVRAVAAAKATLEAGFTTIRDLGTEGAGYADVALRDAIATHIVPGPRIFATTRAIVATGCYGPAGFDPRWSVPQGAEEATGADEVRRVVRSQIARGADWIKVYADYRRAPDAAATATFSQAELNVLVEEAHSAGLPVVAHATTDEGIRRAVLAGVSTIEHGYHASREVLTLMRERGVVLCPTLAASEAVARYAGWNGGEPLPASLQEAKAMFARAREAGVSIACGSDAGVFAHGTNAREIELMVEFGLSPTDALRAATRTAAAVLKLERELGRIQPGYVADMIVVQRDPLRDASALRSPKLVVQRGRIAVDSR